MTETVLMFPDTRVESKTDDVELLNRFIGIQITLQQLAGHVSPAQLQTELLNLHNQLTAALEPLSERLLSKPLAQLVTEAVVVHAGELAYVIPSQAIQRVLPSSQQELIYPNDADGKAFLRITNEMIPVLPLNRDMPPGVRNNKQSLIILEAIGQRCAVVVDEVIGQQHILVQRLQPYLGKLPEVKGCAVLGAGKVGMVVDVEAVLKRC